MSDIKTPIYRGILQSDLELNGFSAGGGSGGSGVTDFLALTDTPDSYAGAANKLVSVNAGATALQFTTAPTGGTGVMPGVFKNVQDAPYNAVGNGIADDTTAIQAAIDAVFTAGGGTVFFPPGTYLCNGAFDATTNSILKIPHNNQSAGVPPKSIELLGNNPAIVNGAGPGLGSIIKTTKTGTGLFPALLAGSAASGVGWEQDYTLSNIHQPTLRNLYFMLPDNPTMYGVRFDSIGMAIVESCTIGTATGAYPATHGTVGLWMPNTVNYAHNIVNNTWIYGFDTGIYTGELLTMPWVYLTLCNTAVQFNGGVGPCVGRVMGDRCETLMKFPTTGRPHPKQPVDLFYSTEHGASYGWTGTFLYDIDDAGNNAYGQIRYLIATAGTGLAGEEIISNGAANLGLTNLYTGDVKIAPGTIKVGTDMRFTPITGGAKLQVRNPGTGLWADADQWTNP